MSYKAFSMSRTGARHIETGRPCQDYSLHEEYNGNCIAVVSDGHGNERHFLSDRGSRIACQTALENIRIFIDEFLMQDNITKTVTEKAIRLLKQEIIKRWKSLVRQDYCDIGAPAPKGEPAGISENVEVYYGCTLCAVFTVGDAWIGIQIGDGSIAALLKNGEMIWPVPESRINEDNLTASLCMPDPMIDFRHIFFEDRPASIYAYTDGIEKVLPDGGKGITVFLDWLKKISNSDSRDDDLKKNLDIFTRRSSIGDDVSVAVIYSSDVDCVNTDFSKTDRDNTYRQLMVKADELLSTLSYYETMIEEIDEDDKEQSDRKRELQKVVDRKRKELSGLLHRIKELDYPEREKE